MLDEEQKSQEETQEQAQEESGKIAPGDEQIDSPDKDPEQRPKKPHRLKLWLRRLALVALLLVIWPFLALPLYNLLNPVSVPMLARYVTLRPVTHHWLSVDELSDRLKASVMMSEDGQFCQHHGVDWPALETVLTDFRAGKRVRGASTITMQLVKNLFLWNNRSYIRKALEVPLALYADRVLPKQRILEIYLNIAEWGPTGQFGAEAGSRHFFAKSAQAMTWQRAARMAVTLPNPVQRNPASPSRTHANIARIIESRAHAASPYITCVYNGPVRLK